MDLPLEGAYIWGCSVHGLVCICSGDGGGALWNPSIRKLKKISSPNFELLSPEFGFGYDSVNVDYKVVGFWRHAKISTLDNNCSSYEVLSCEVKVYSLKSNSWKMIQNFPIDDLPPNHFTRIVNLNGGCLCWIISPSSNPKIGTLDLATENFREFLTLAHRYAYDSATLAVLGGCLCISVTFSNFQRDLWIMECGVTESWTLLCSIDQGAMPSMDHLFYPILRSSKNGEMVLFTLAFIWDLHNTLFWYDLEKGSVKPVELGGLPGHVCNPTVCVGSLGLLDDGIPLPIMSTHAP